MIPHKLQIKNFLSYGNDLQTIDFSSYQLICLTGKNGHGKSALLDAMTWALWGQARKTTASSRADEGLLRLGQTSMIVNFDFELNSNKYRIRREYTHSYGKPYAVLEFGVYDTQTDSFHSLTDKTIKSTQQKIEQTLRLDFEAFANSAFLRQGQSNEFSKKSPKERKEILAAILGLDDYDTLRRLALDKVKQAALEKQTTLMVQEKIEQELSKERLLQEQITIVQQALNDHEASIQRIYQDIQELNAALNAVTQHEKERDLLITYLHRATQEHLQLKEQTRLLITQWRSVHKKSLGTFNIVHLKAQQKELYSVLQICQQQQLESHRLTQALLQNEASARRISQAHEHQHAQLMHQAQLELERSIMERDNKQTLITTTSHDIAAHQAELSTLSNHIKLGNQANNEYHNLEQQVQASEQQFIKRKAAYQKYITQANWLSNEWDMLNNHRVLIESPHNPCCPLCKQDVQDTLKMHLTQQLNNQIATIEHRLHRLKTILPQLKATLIEHHNGLEHLKQKRQKATQQQARLEEITKQHTQVNSKCQDLKAALFNLEQQLHLIDTVIKEKTAHLNHLEQTKHERLATHTEYRALCATIQQTENAIRALNYSEQELTATHDKLSVITALLSDHEAFEQDITLQHARKMSIEQHLGTLKKCNEKIKELQTQHVSFAHLSTTRQDLTRKEQVLKDSIQTIALQKEQLLQQKGSLEQQLTMLTHQKTEHNNNRRLIEQLNATIDDYQTIALATSKDGIQALLIENAIPEIETEANNILAKLTNNQAHIIIDSLRDLKRGGTKETLDIKISDATGIRAYELFSGGEAFRIDFALRIAISKLLARRAGTALQTLIIDEGFGSQDEEGLSTIMDALYKIQDDFHKIIIVSHLPAMKEQFPVHFVVDKQSHGSVVTVVEHA